MASKLFESANFVVLIAVLAATYGIGYCVGYGLTGSVLVALVAAFFLSCISMISIVLLAPGRLDRGANRP